MFEHFKKQTDLCHFKNGRLIIGIFLSVIDAFFRQDAVKNNCTAQTMKYRNSVIYYFAGSKYAEKCDVYSWGIILWEILSRERPFKDLSSTVYTIMWWVHLGIRPPLIADCPPQIEKLYTR